jgi:hypothetical protein
MKKAGKSDIRTTPRKQTDVAPAGIAFKRPFKPRPGLFYAMLGLLGIWVGILLTLYFVTVYPNRHRHTEPQDAAPAEAVPRQS